MVKLGVLCGFKTESQCFERTIKGMGLDESSYVIAMSGSTASGAAREAEALVAEGATFLLSFGIAGGLTPAMRVGDVVFSNHVVTLFGENFGTQSKEAPLPALRSGTLHKAATVCGVDRILLTPQQKAQCYQKSGAAIADMESHALARVAEKHALPFFVLRSVSDGANDLLPDFVASAVDEKGNPKLATVLLALLKKPWLLSDMLRLKKHTDLAIKSLEEATARLLPHLLKS